MPVDKLMAQYDKMTELFPLELFISQALISPFPNGKF